MSESLSESEIRRYARHIVLPELGGIGQARLKAARVLVIGAGGLGGPLALYLAAAGVGTIGIVDDDLVDLSNLQRQVIFGLDSLGAGKAATAAQALRRLNDEISVEIHPRRLDTDNCAAIIAPYDLVADGSDNLETRFAVSDTCHRLGKPLVSAAVQALDGQLTTYTPHLGHPHPCLRCLVHEAPGADALPSCAQGGVLGPAAGVMATLQAVEVVKELAGIGTSLSGRLVLYDARETLLERLTLPRRPECRSRCVCLGAPRGAVGVGAT